MTEKKISRRGFIKRLAACSVVIPFLPKMFEAKPEMIVGVDKALEGSDNTSVALVTWDEDSIESVSWESDPSKEFFADLKTCNQMVENLLEKS